MVDVDRLEPRAHPAPEDWPPEVYEALVASWALIFLQALRRLDAHTPPNEPPPDR